MREDRKKTCLQCGCFFEVRCPKEMTTKKYCSNKCNSESRRKEKVKIICSSCNKVFEVIPAKALKAKFCSCSCRSYFDRRVKDPLYRMCSKCKEIKSIDDFHKDGGSRRSHNCKICKNEINREKSRNPNCRFTHSVWMTEHRGSKWEIEKEDYFKLIDSPCHYCGGQLNPTGIGLDKKNSNNKCYSLDNVVPCCQNCNRVKCDIYTHKEMIVIAQHIKLIDVQYDDYVI